MGHILVRTRPASSRCPLFAPALVLLAACTRAIWNLAPARELSTLAGTFLGARLLQEKAAPARLAGAACIVFFLGARLLQEKAAAGRSSLHCIGSDQSGYGRLIPIAIYLTNPI